MKNDAVGGRVYSPTDETSYESEVCKRYTSALCSPSRLSLATAELRLWCGEVSSQRTLVCDLSCHVAPLLDYESMNEEEVRVL